MTEKILSTPSDEVEQLRRIRELCIKALVRATGYSRDAIEDAPLTCAIKHADEVERLRSASSETKERKPNIEAFMASVVPPPGYVMEQYDLTKNEEVIRMAKEIGGEWAEGLMPLVKAMEMEQRVLFFSALWATPLGHCCASIGEEGTQAVLDTMKLLAHGIGQRNEKKGPPQ